jgi:hypothetical protein
MEPSLAPVFAATLCDPASPAHDFQGSSQSGAVYRQYFAEVALGNFPS